MRDNSLIFENILYGHSIDLVEPHENHSIFLTGGERVHVLNGAFGHANGNALVRSAADVPRMEHRTLVLVRAQSLEIGQIDDLKRRGDDFRLFSLSQQLALAVFRDRHEALHRRLGHGRRRHGRCAVVLVSVHHVSVYNMTGPRRVLLVQDTLVLFFIVEPEESATYRLLFDDSLFYRRRFRWFGR